MILWAQWQQQQIGALQKASDSVCRFVSEVPLHSTWPFLLPPLLPVIDPSNLRILSSGCRRAIVHKY